MVATQKHLLYDHDCPKYRRLPVYFGWSGQSRASNFYTKTSKSTYEGLDNHLSILSKKAISVVLQGGKSPELDLL